MQQNIVVRNLRVLTQQYHLNLWRKTFHVNIFRHTSFSTIYHKIFST